LKDDAEVTQNGV